MTEHQHRILEATAQFVQETLQGAEAGHDWWHIQRVRNNTRTLARLENADSFVAELAALLHDIADSKFHDGDETIGPRLARQWLESQDIDPKVTDHVVAIIENISFKGGNTERNHHSPELDVVQDADRLDALGAIGIARTFHYGGFKNRELYNPGIPPSPGMDKETYKNSTAPTINHFYEKLLLLKDRMNTPSGKVMAEERHAFLEQFLDRFYKEWEGA